MAEFEPGRLIVERRERTGRGKARALSNDSNPARFASEQQYTRDSASVPVQTWNVERIPSSASCHYHPLQTWSVRFPLTPALSLRERGCFWQTLDNLKRPSWR